MKKYKSKSSFLRELNLLLAFHFEEQERYGIMNDYEDYFTNEASDGRSEFEICSSLESPKKIVENLCSETNTDHLALLKNTSAKILLISIFFFVLELVFFMICKRYSLHYFYFALLNKVLYLGCGIWICRKSRLTPFKFKAHFAILCAALLVFFFEASAIAADNTNHRVGMLYTAILWMVILASCFLGLYFIFSIQKNHRFYFSILFHLSGLISICLYFIYESGLLYKDTSEFLKSRIECGILYAVTILFCTIFQKIKVKGC